MIKKVNFLLTRSQKLNIFLIFLGNLFNSVLEFISLGSIPVFISYIVSPNLTDNKFQYFIDIIFSFTNKENLIIIFLGIIFLVFLLKNFFLGLILFLEARFSYDFRKSLTNKLFKKYINLPYLFHTNTNPLYNGPSFLVQIT